MSLKSTCTKVSRGLFKVVTYVLLIYGSIRVLPQAPVSVIGGLALLILVFTGYHLATGSDSFHFSTFLLNFLSIQALVYVLFSSSDMWFSFHGLELVATVLLGVIAWVVTDVIAVTIVGSVVYGDLSNFSNELDKRSTDNHPDPYGDKHAHRILNQSE